jgi:twitching motility protein PilT
MDIASLLTYTQQKGASDLHLSSHNPAIVRLHGDMMPIEGSPPLNPSMIKQMMYSIMTDQQRGMYEHDLELDFSITLGANMRFRVNAFNTMNGPSAVFRTIPTKILTLDELNCPPVFRQMCNIHKGLILVTGPTGSGKSTTLAAMINHINENMSRHILTIEDPIEFVHQSKRSLINQREVGASTKSFAKALKSSLREDPDIILVGELRDLETIQLAMTAAETGHLVMGTLHTNSAPKTIDRIIDVFPANDKPMIRAMLSISLQAVISQALVKKIGGGRVAAHEIMVGTPAIRNLIREAKIPQLYSLMQMGSKMGMITMKDSLYKLMQQDIITVETVKDVLSEAGDEEAANNIPQATAATGARPANNF